MVTIVANQTLGLLSQGVNVQQGNQIQANHLGVNITTGNLILQQQDLLLVGLGQDTSHLRTYNSLGLMESHAWFFNQERHLLIESSEQIIKINKDGSESIFTWDAGRNAFYSTDGDGAHDTIQVNASGEWVWQDGHGEAYEVYDEHGQIIRLADRNGNQTLFSYDNGLLMSRADASGETVTWRYESDKVIGYSITSANDNGEITRVSKVRYAYDTLNRLTSVVIDLSPDDESTIDGNVFAIEYTYHGSSFRLASLAQTDGFNQSFEYIQIDGGYRLRSITENGVLTQSFTYDVAAKVTTLTDVSGLVTEYHYDDKQRLNAIKKPGVSDTQTVSYQYDNDNNIIRVTDENGHSIYRTYNDEGLLVKERDSLGQTIRYEYNDDNQLTAELRFRDADTDGAGPSYAEDLQATQFIYDDSGNLIYQIDAEGRVSQFVYNDLGQMEQNIAFTSIVYALPELQLDQSFALSDALTKTDLEQFVNDHEQLAEAVVTEYEYNHRGQLKYKYDYQETRLAVYRIGVVSRTEYQYTIGGLLIAEIDNDNQVTSYSYDGLDRVTVIKNAKNEQTMFQYIDAERKTIETKANGLVTTTFVDFDGKVLSVLKQDDDASKQEYYHYNDNDQLIAIRRANGFWAFKGYDDLGRLSYEVSTGGMVHGYAYDAEGNLINTHIYEPVIDTVAWVSDDSLVTTALESDIADFLSNESARTRYAIYDTADRLAFKVDEMGYLTEYIYTNDGKLFKEVAYDVVLSLQAGVTYSVIDIQQLLYGGSIRLTSSFEDYETLRDPIQPYLVEEGGTQSVEVNNPINEPVTISGISHYTEGDGSHDYSNQYLEQNTSYTIYDQTIEYLIDPAIGYDLHESDTFHHLINQQEAITLNYVDLGSSQRVVLDLDTIERQPTDNINGLTGDLNHIAYDNGRVKIYNLENNDAGRTPKRFYSVEKFDLSSDFSMTSEITLSSDYSWRTFALGIIDENNLTAESHYIEWWLDELNTRYFDGSNSDYGEWDWNYDDATYVIDVSVVNGISTISVYEKGQPSDSGLKDVRDISHWGDGYFYMEALQEPNMEEDFIYFDALSITGNRVNVQTQATVTNQRTGATQIVEAFINEGQYVVDFDGNSSDTYHILVEQIDLLTQRVLTSMEHTLVATGTHLVDANKDYSYFIDADASKISGVLSDGVLNGAAEITAVVRNTSGQLVSQTITAPAMFENYDGSVYLTTTGQLEHGTYDIYLSITYSNGESVDYPPFTYKHQSTTASADEQVIRWRKLGTEETRVDFRYTLADSNSSHAVTVNETDSYYYVSLPVNNGDIVDYEIIYYDVNERPVVNYQTAVAVDNRLETAAETAFGFAFDENLILDGTQLTNIDLIALFDGLSSINDYNNIESIRATPINSENQAYTTVETRPEWFDDYVGQINLAKNTNLPAGKYTIALEVTYKDSSVATAELDFHLGSVDQTIQWSVSNRFNSTAGTLYYRLANTNDEYRPVTADYINGQWQATLTDLEPGETYAYYVVHGESPSIASWRASSQFTANGDSPIQIHLSGIETYYNMQAIDSLVLKNVVTGTELSNVTRIDVHLHDELDDDEYSAIIYPELFDSFSGDVLLSDGLKPEGGRYQLQLTLTFADETTRVEHHILELGPQVEENRDTTLTILKSDLPEGTYLMYRYFDANGSGVWQSFEETAEAYTYIQTNGFNGRTAFGLGLFDDESDALIDSWVTQDWKDDEQREWLINVSSSAGALITRSTHYIYDASGLLVGEVDPRGYITEHVYDGAKRKVKTIRYANHSGYLSFGRDYTMADLRPSASDNDLIERLYYDGANNLVAKIDAENYLTALTYNAMGQLVAEKRYQDRITDTNESIDNILVVANLTNDVIKQTNYDYDALGRVQLSRSIRGLETVFDYDEVGNLRSEIATDTNNPGDTRTLLRRYDGFGRLSSELKGEALLSYLHASESNKESVWQTLAAFYHYDENDNLTESSTVVGGDLSDLQSVVRGTAQFLYDEHGQLRFSIAVDGSITEKSYNNLGEVIANRQYTNTLPISSSIAGGFLTDAIEQTLWALKSSRDTEQTFDYDDRGLLIAQRNAIGAETTTDYNRFGDVIKTSVLMNSDEAQYWVTEYGYNAGGQVTSKSEQDGDVSYRSETMVYDAFGRLVSTADYLGNTRKQTYDKLGRVISVTDKLGRSSSTSYDALNREVSITDAGGFTTSLTYDDASGIMRRTSPSGVVITTRLNGFGEVSRETLAETRTTFNQYNADGNVIVQGFIGDDGEHRQGTTKTDYDAAGRVVAKTDAFGNRLEWVYDALGRVVAEHRVGAVSTLTTQFEYDGKGNQVRVVAADNVITEMSYDAANRNITIVENAGDSALSRLTTIDYDEANQKVEVQVSAGSGNERRRTQYEYDTFGRMTKMIEDPDGLARTTSYTFDVFNNMKTQQYAEQATITYSYDLENQQISAITDELLLSSADYNDRGLVARSTHAGVTSYHVFDGDGREQYRIDSAGYVSEWQYDDTGLLAKEIKYERAIDTTGIDEGLTASDVQARIVLSDKDRITETVYNKRGAVEAQRDALGYISRYHYDANGRLTGVSQLAEKNAAIFLVNAANIAISDQDKTTYYVYDDFGRQAASVDSLGRVQIQSFDDVDRVLVSSRYEQALPLSLVESSLTLKSRLLQGMYSLNDVLNTVGNSDVLTTRSAYDALGRQTIQIDTYGLATRFNYNIHGERLTQRSHADIYQLDSEGNILVSNSDDDRISNFAYDNLGRLLYQTDASGYLQAFAYDAADNVKQAYRYKNAYSDGRELDLAAAIAETAATESESDQIDYYYYDQRGKQILHVNTLGYAVETIYNHHEQVHYIKSYEDKVSVTHLSTEASLLNQLASSDYRRARNSYNQRGQLASSENAAGVVTSYTYNAYGQIAAQSTSIETLHYAYDARGQSVSTSRLQQEVYEGDTRYEGTVALEKNYDFLGYETHSFASVGDSEQRKLYDSVGQLIFEINGEGNVTQYAYDNFGRKYASYQFATSVDITQVSTIDDVSAQLGSIERAQYFIYNENNQLAYQIDGEGHVEQSLYNAFGELQQTARYDTRLISQTYTFEALNSLLANRTSISETYEYTKRGEREKVIDALGHFEFYTFDAFGNQVTMTNKESNTWTYVYDQNNRLISEISPQVAIQLSDETAAIERSLEKRMTYDAFDNMLSLAEAYGTVDERTTYYTYDQLNNQLSAIQTDAGEYSEVTDSIVDIGVNYGVHTKYDGYGRAIANKDVKGHTQYRTYDSQNRVRYEIDAMGYVTENRYNAMGDKTAVIRYSIALNLFDLVAFDDLEEAISETWIAEQVRHDTQARALITQYDKAGRKAAVVQSSVETNNNYAILAGYSGQPKTTYIYDSLGQIIEQREYTSAVNYLSQLSFYDQAGQLTASVDAAGYVTALEYDEQGNINKKTEYATALTVEQRLNLIGGLQHLPLPSSSHLDRVETYDYDALNRQTYRYIHGVDYSRVSYIGTDAYDAELNIDQRAMDVVSETIYNNQTLTFETQYDNLGNVTETIDAQGKRNITRYNELGFTTTEDNYLSTDELSVGISFILDAFGNVVKKSISAGTETRHETMLYDRWGNVVKMTDAAGISNFVRYDASGNVIREWHYNSQSYAGWSEQNYDFRVEKSYEYNANNQQTTLWQSHDELGFVRYEYAIYNAFGEVAQKDLDDAQSEIYHYDNAGRVTLLESNNTKTRYYYDLAGRLVAEEKISELDTTATNRFTYYVLDGLGRKLTQVAPSKDGTLSTTRTLQTFDRWGNLIETQNAEGARQTYEYNRLGQLVRETSSPVDVFGEAQARSLISSFAYDINGNRIKNTDTAGTVRYAGFDEQSQQLWQTDAYGYRTRYSYDDWGNKISATDAKGSVIVDQYDINNRLIKRGIQANGVYTRMESYEYDTAGNRTHVVLRGDAEDRVEYTVYNSRNNVVATRTAAGYEKHYQYNDRNQKIVEWLGDTDTKRAEWYYENGQLVKSIDFGGHIKTYIYNAFGEVGTEYFYQDNDAYEREYSIYEKSYSYNDLGWVTNITSKNVVNAHNEETITSYKYNNIGQRTQETHSETRYDASFTRTITTEYDALGRIKTLTSPTEQWSAFGESGTTSSISNLTYQYDALGNRMHIGVNGTNADGSYTRENYYYTFDLESRMLLSQGVLDNNGDVVLNEERGALFSYNALGQRANAVFYIEDDDLDSGYNKRHESYEYNAFGQLTKVRAYDDTIWQVFSYWTQSYLPSRYWRLKESLVPVNNDNPVYRIIDEREYTDEGFMSSQRTYYTDGNAKSYATTTYNNDGQTLYQSSWEAEESGDELQQTSSVSYNANSYDDAGSLIAYKVYIYEKGNLKYLDEHTKSYVYYDSAQLDVESVRRSKRKSGSWELWGNRGTTIHRRALDGTLKEVSLNERYMDSDRATAWSRYFYTNNDGQIVGRVDKGDDPDTSSDEIVYRYQDYYYVNGQSIGTNGTISGIDFDNNYTPISESYPAGVSSSYVVNNGDTLASIARSVFGDASRWFIIAEANGISSDDELSAGQRLTIPNVVTGVSNNSDTFAPYNPAEVIGDTSPSPVAPPPPKSSCNPIVMIIMVVVAVVVTVYTAGAAASFFATGGLGGVGGAGLFATGSSALLGGGAVAGAAAGTALGTAAAIGGAFVGGVMGSVASQLVGKAMGVVESFSLRSAFANGLTTAFTAGIGAMAGGAAQAAQGAQNATSLSQVNSFKTAAQYLKYANNFGSNMMMGAVNYMSSYAANKIAGVETSFSWSGIAAASLGSAVGSKLQLPGDSDNTFIKAINENQLLRDFSNNFISGAVGATAQRLLNKGGKQDWGQIAVDSFGNALAEGVKASLSEHEAQKVLERKMEAVGNVPEALAPTVLTMIQSGKDPEKVRQFIANENISNGLASLNNIMLLDKSTLLTTPEPEETGEYALLGGQRVPIVPLSSKGELMLDIFEGAEQIVRGANQLTEGLHIEEVIELTMLALLGPSKYLFDKGVGYATEYLGGEYIMDMLDTAGDVLTAGVYGDSLKETEELIDYSNRYKQFEDKHGEAKAEEALNTIPLEKRAIITKTVELGEKRSQAKTGALALVSLVAAAFGTKEGIGLLRNRLNSGKLSQREKDRLMNEARMEADHDMDKVPNKIGGFLALKRRAEALDAADGGHSLLRHGPDVSDADLRRRALTGISPDNKWSPTHYSTKFDTYDDWLKTRDDAILRIQQDKQVNFGANMDVAPAPGTPTRYELEIDHGRAIDSGFNGIGPRTQVVNPYDHSKSRNLHTQVTPVSGITKSYTKVAWDVDASRWKVVQHFPVSKNWNQALQQYEP